MRILLSSKRGSKSKLFSNSTAGNGAHSSSSKSASETTSFKYTLGNSKESLLSNNLKYSNSTEFDDVIAKSSASLHNLENDSQTCVCFPNGNYSSPPKNNIKKGLYLFGNEVRFVNKSSATQIRNFVHLKNCPVGGNSVMSGNAIYHEKQVKSLCALHALNNLLQDARAFSKDDLDMICSNLSPDSWVNPHKSVLGLGNYDINVIMKALQTKDYETIWFDKRKDPSMELNFANIYGYILNVPSDCKIGWLSIPLKRKHWVAIRRLPQARESSLRSYYNLDSKLESPDNIGSEDSLIKYLRDELSAPEKELFLVVTADIARSESWKKGKNSENSVGGSCTNFDNSEGIRDLNDIPLCYDIKDIRKTSNDSGVVELLSDFKDINVVDLDKEDLFRRQSSGIWSDFN